MHILKDSAVPTETELTESERSERIPFVDSHSNSTGFEATLTIEPTSSLRGVLSEAGSSSGKSESEFPAGTAAKRFSWYCEEVE